MKMMRTKKFVVNVLIGISVKYHQNKYSCVRFSLASVLWYVEELPAAKLIKDIDITNTNFVKNEFHFTLTTLVGGFRSKGTPRLHKIPVPNSKLSTHGIFRFRKLQAKTLDDIDNELLRNILVFSLPNGHCVCVHDKWIFDTALTFCLPFCVDWMKWSAQILQNDTSSKIFSHVFYVYKST